VSLLWAASERFGISAAPGGTALVQDFLNTKAIEAHPDLLADPILATAWATRAVDAWSDARGGEPHRPPSLTTADVGKLRALRATLAGLVGDDGDASPVLVRVPATLALTETGDVRLTPAGAGWRWLASALWGEILLSQQAGTWRRLKQCHNADCRSTFYDRSKNNSGVWHSVKVCGNAANLRASRARRRRSHDDADNSPPASQRNVQPAG
jgi:predicted RNA-binding Zn ribbon-like protein